jgi:hypothetical protein
MVDDRHLPGREVGIGRRRARDTSTMSVNEDSALQDQPTRCSLVSQSTMAGASCSEAKSFNISNFKLSLAIGVGKNAISVVDPNTNALVASEPLAPNSCCSAGGFGRTIEVSV